MAGISDALRHELSDPEYSEGYAESFLNSYIATQIKVLREQRHLKQSELAELIGTTQTGISRIENVNYSSWNTKTLKRLARALRVRLRVSFESYGTLPEEVEGFSRASLQRPAREEDPGLADAPAAAVASIVDPPLPRAAGNVTCITDYILRHHRNIEQRAELPSMPMPTQQGGTRGAISGLVG